jgi:hypothetical protein
MPTITTNLRGLLADELLRPIHNVICVTCKSKGTIYPDGEKGSMHCPKCSPAWLKDFLIWRMNHIREDNGLEPV